jgi:hypothetical protein
MTRLRPSSSKLVRANFFFIILFKLKVITEASVKLEGALEIVVGLLGEIVVILKDTLTDLKLIAVAELTLAGVDCTIRELAVVVAALLIVRTFHTFVCFFFTECFAFFVACYQSHLDRSVRSWLRRCCSLPCHRHYWVC